MIEELRRFRLVAKEKNITKTAEKLFLTQSALSQSLHRLEKALNAKLYRQQGKQFALTPEGEAILTISDKILSLWETAQDPTRRTVSRTVYTVGLFDNGALLLGDVLRNQMHTSQYDLELIIDRSHILRMQLQLGILDLALVVLDDTTGSNLRLLHRFTEELIPVAMQPFVEPLEQIPFILYNKGSSTRKQIDRTFTQVGITPLIFAESTSVSFMKELVIHGAGVALLPENFIHYELQQGRVHKQRLPIHWERTFGLYTHTESPLSLDHPLVQQIITKLSSFSSQ